MSNTISIHKQIDIIQDFAKHDGTEYGEMLILLCSICRSSMISDALKDSVENEVIENYRHITDNFQKIERQETHTQTITEWVEK